MKLFHSIIIRLTPALLSILGLWAGLFYIAIVDEIRDETDDLLEDYSVRIMQNFLAGEDIPSVGNGSNSTYHLRKLNADSVPLIKDQTTYSYERIYIKYKREDESARVIKRVFQDKQEQYYLLTVAIPTVDEAEFIEEILKWIFALFVLLTITMLLINYLVLRRGLAPLDSLMRWLNKSSVENTLASLDVDSRTYEIKEISKAVGAFALRSHKAFEQQKEFIANASHEFQTPIAICKNTLELLCEEDLSEEQVKEVGKCLNALTRLSRLNRSLLMLSRIDNGQFESETISINSIVEQSLDSFRDIYSYRNINISLEIKGDCSVTMNRDLANTLVSNLIKNSFIHSQNNASFRLRIETTRLIVANSSEGESLDAQRIFERFYHDPSKKQSHGLGLSIVQSICHLYKYHITYRHEHGMHVFEIVFA